MLASSSKRHLYSPLGDDILPSLQVFEDWLHRNGVTRHPGIEISAMTDGGGYRVLAKQDIDLGTVLCDIPISLLLSHRTTSLESIPLPPLSECSTSLLTLHLATCLLHELRLGESSRWYGWLQFLPREIINIPTFWEDKEIGGEDGRKGLEWLEGTEGWRELERKNNEGLSLTDMKDFYHSIEHLLPSTPSHPNSSPVTSYLYAMSLISSRAFVVDAYHGIALVPFVDFFNHSSIKSHTSLLCTEYVCPQCGSLPECEHDLPTANSGIAERLAHLPLERIRKLNTEKPSVDMRVERYVYGEEEIFSCYDEGVGDGKLLVEWGFTEDNGLDGLHWSPREIFIGDKIEMLRHYVGIMQRGSVENYFEDQLSDHQTRLIKMNSLGGSFTSQQKLEPTVPMGLVVATYLCEVKPDVEDIENVERKLMRLFDTLHQYSTSGHRASDADNQVKEEVSDELLVTDTILQFLDRRLESLHRPEPDIQDLHKYCQNLPVDSILERQGLQMAIQERSKLENIQDQWRVIRSSLASAAGLSQQDGKYDA